ncbi:MAG: hypothetical protein II801_01855, partial [Bacteroidaceae bacterium]|nr:hypothetical protein [Bacteroidaceae bacterium]
MKRLAAILPLLLLLSALFGCGSRTRVSARLDALDTLVVDYPDSVLAALQSIRPQMENESESLRMQYKLLCIKAGFLADGYSKNDSTIFSVLYYYEHHPDKHLTPEAYYYTGRTYESLGDALRATDYYNKALEMLPEDLKDRKSVFLRGCVFSHMGSLLYKQGLYEQALVCCQMVYNYDRLLGRKSMVVLDERDLGFTYYALNMKDSAFYYYDKAEQTALSLGDSVSLSYVRQMRVDCYRNEGDYQQALELNSRLLPSVTSTTAERVYYLQGELYMRLHQLDSSRIYFQKVLELPNLSPFSKGNANKALGEMALWEGRLSEAVSHLNTFIFCLDSIEQMQKKEAVLKAHELYNYNLRERENQRLTLDNVRKTYLIVTLLLALLLLATVSMLVVKHHHRLSQIEKMRRQMTVEREQHHERLAALEMQKKELEIEQKNIRLSYLRRYIEKHSDIIERLSSVDSSAESFVRLTDAEWERLAVALDEYDENFVSRLRS